MELSGKIIQILEAVSGTSKTGNSWTKQEFIVEYGEGQYPKKVCLSDWSEKLKSQLVVGNDVTVSFDAESREYNGRWYTELRAWKMQTAAGSPASVITESPASAAQVSNPIPAQLEGEDDLPF
jgi:hypothetical protein